MSLYSIEKYCPEDSKKYKTISVGGLRAEQFTIKIDQFYRENTKIRIFNILKFPDKINHEPFIHKGSLALINDFWVQKLNHIVSFWTPDTF